MSWDKRPSTNEPPASTEVKFGEELKKRLSILQSQEDFALSKTAEENERMSEQIESGTTETRRKNVSIFRPLQRFIPSGTDVTDDEKEEKRPRQPTYLVISLATSIIAGLLIGALMTLRSEPYTEREVFYIKFPGTLFQRSVQILLIPYLTSSIISSVGKVPSLVFFKISSKVVVYSILMSLSASFLGIIVSFSIPDSPGRREGQMPQKDFNVAFGVVEICLDIFLNILPNNIVYACVATERIRISEDKNVSGVIKGSYEIQTVERTNYLGLVVFCVLVGLALRQIGSAAEWFFCLTDVITKLMVLITSWLLWASPVGLFFVIIGEIVNHDWGIISTKVAVFSGLFVLGLTMQCLLLVPLVFYVITFTNPFRYLYNTSFGISAGFATCTSFSALPFMLEGLRHNKVNPLLASAVLPLLVTISKNSNALLSSLLASYLVRRTDLGMTLVKALQILFFATFSNNQVTLDASLLQNLLNLGRHVGIKEGFAREEVEIFVSAGWLLDRLRVCGNILGHVLGVKIIQRISGKELKHLKSKEHIECNSLYTPTRKMASTKAVGFALSK